jgi:subtilisin family serine protease
MHRSIVSVFLLVTFAGAASATPTQQAEPGSVSVAAFGGMVHRDRVRVRFDNTLQVRLIDNQLQELTGKGLPAGLPAGSWLRAHFVSDDELQRQRTLAMNRLQRDLPDMRNEYILVLAPGITVEQAIDQLRAATGVARVAPIPLPAPAPLPPNYQPNQGYQNPTPAGTGCETTWTWPGGRGQNVQVCDIEYSFNASHNDLPAVTIAGPVGVDPFNDNNHGTAVMGILVGRDNGWGVTGGAHEAGAKFAYCNFATIGYSVSTGLINAAAALQPGDVILIEQQSWGPNSPPLFQGGFVPSEWDVFTYDATVQAVGAGVIVVATAGNGNENLDAPIMNSGNGGHWPFLENNNSGAIMVGAGAAASGFGNSDTPRSRQWYSNYGSRLDVQGWGERVYSTGYGGIFNAEGVNRWYTSTFGGTSSAGPVVASTVAALSSIYEAVEGAPLDPANARNALMASGAAQQSGIRPASQRIGNLPDIRGAFGELLGNADCNNNGTPDRIDITAGTATDNNNDLIPDSCQFCDSIDFNQNGVFPEDQDVVDFFNVLAGGSCPACSDIDFNNNGVFPEDQDVVDFFNVLAGSTCP